MASGAKHAPGPVREAQQSRSWIDRLIDWVERLPGPAWLYYLAGTLALALLITLVLWVDGSVPVGAYGYFEGVFPPFVFYFLALYHYLTRVGARSLQAFRPLLNGSKADFASIELELSTLPRWAGWVSIVTAIATLPPYFTTGQAFGDLSPNTVLPYIVAAAASALFGATIFAVLIRSFRQLRLVHHLHTQATNINLLKLAPAHAFSDLTARTGMGLVVLLFLGFLYNPTSFSGSYLVAAYVLIAVPAVVIFIAPVIGMRGRLAAEKLRALDDTSERLQATYERLESNIDEGEYRDLQGMETAVSALLRKRQLLQEISTWPWDPGTLRGFASTLLLPILLWLVTRLLGRLI